MAILIVMGLTLILGLLAFIPATAAERELHSATRSLSAGRAALIQGGADEARTEFVAAAAAFRRARAHTENPFFRVAGFLPFAGRTPDTVSAITEAGLLMTRAGQELVGGAERLPGGLLSLVPRDGRIPLRTFRMESGPLNRAAALLQQALRVVEAVPTGFLVPSVADARANLATDLADTAAAVTTAAALTRALPSFLGADEPRRYFVAAQNPAELRGTGGLIGAYSILTANRGRIHLAGFRPASSLPTVPPERVEAPNPDYARLYDRYGSRGQWANVNITPDFPSAAVAIERLYEETQGVRLDGTIAADPFALAGLVRVLGPVELRGTGVVLDARNLVRYVTNQAYAQLTDSSERKAVLGDVAREILGRFIGGDLGEVPTPPKAGGSKQQPSGGKGGGKGGAGLIHPAVVPAQGQQGGQGLAAAQALIEAAADGHLLFHSANPPVQRAFEMAGITGALQRESGDFLSVIANNASGTKLDFYLRRDISYRVELGDDGSATGTAMIGLGNTAPDHGLPTYVIGPHPETELEAGENRLLVGAYCGSCLLERFTSDGRRQGTGSEEELGHPFYTVSVDLPSDASQQLEYVWTTAHAWDEEEGTYRLEVRGQPSIRPTSLRLSIVPPEGMSLSSLSTGMREENGAAVWEGVLEDRMVFEISFRRSFLGEILHFLSQPVIRF
jgi:hypothetical protein